VSCYGVSDAQLAAELFEHERQAQGTLVLDGVGEVSLSLQDALLRFFDNEARTASGDVRLIACSRETCLETLAAGASDASSCQ
jgi:DNA-binding NtrC family response regulator